MPTTIGIVFGPFEETAKEILSYLLVYQNTLQNSFEFHILPFSSDSPFLDMLSAEPAPRHADIDLHIDDFFSRVKSSSNEDAKRFGLDPIHVDKIVLLTNTAFSDNYYYVGDATWAIVALGGWENDYAPPSIVEYYLSFVALAALDVRTDIGRHFETRGCIYDFNASLGDARLSVLTGHICDACANAIKTQTSNQVLKDAQVLLRRAWLGDSSTPSDVAVTVNKLGYDLFRTAGIKPTWKERWLATIEQEGMKNALSMIFQILLLAALLVLGLKKNN
jgi:hypothetical protein